MKSADQESIRTYVIHGIKFDVTGLHFINYRKQDVRIIYIWIEIDFTSAERKKFVIERNALFSQYCSFFFFGLNYEVVLNGSQLWEALLSPYHNPD